MTIKVHDKPIDDFLTGGSWIADSDQSWMGIAVLDCRPYTHQRGKSPRGIVIAFRDEKLSSKTARALANELIKAARIAEQWAADHPVVAEKGKVLLSAKKKE